MARRCVQCGRMEGCMIEMLFLLGFSLHNIEEALWLPQWSKRARRFHREVSENEFRFSVIIVTAVGYLLTFQYYIWSDVYAWSKYVYLGFVLMMVINAVFPHLLATIVLKSYAPGTITGLMLNVPVGLYILATDINGRGDLIALGIALAGVAAVTLAIINILFKAAPKLLSCNE